MSEILFLAHRVPYPPNRGDKIRSWNVLKALAKIAPVHVAALCDDPDDMQYAEKLSTVAASVHLVPHQPSRVGAMLSALLTGQSASVRACTSPAMRACSITLPRKRPISTIYAFSGQMAQYVESSTSARFVMDFVDMDSAKFARWGEERGGLSGLANGQEGRRLFAFENAVARRADASLFVSDAEAELFRRKSGLGNDKVKVLENGIDLDHFSPAHANRAEPSGEGPIAVFTGQMDYIPNVEAVEWFARKVLPLIPNLRFAIVGRAPVERVKALAALRNVTVTGAVDDTRDWIAAADVVVAPLLLARGVQNKVLEAMAMGKAVLASPAAAEGIDVVPGRELVVVEAPEAQAEAIRHLLADDAKRAALGGAARTRMETRYSWASTLAGLPELIGVSA